MTSRRIAAQNLLACIGLTLAYVVGLGMQACTLFNSTAPTVLTATQDACQAIALAESFIPPGTSASAVAHDLELACGIAESAEAYLEQVVLAYEAAQTDAGVGAVYRPGPMILRARGFAGVGPKP